MTGKWGEGHDTFNRTFFRDAMVVVDEGGRRPELAAEEVIQKI